MIRWRRAARSWHGVTAAVAAFALALQLVLVIDGAATLLPENAVPLPVALARFIAYFTIQSNLAVLIASVTLLRRPDRDGPAWRVLRADAVAGIAVTGVVHWFLLRPLLDLQGASAVADGMLHLVVPVLALLGWVIFGPRPRLSLRTVLLALVWPIAWTVVIVAQGWVTRWYPYPFLNAHVLGAGPVAIYVVVITGAFMITFGLLTAGDRWLPGGGRQSKVVAG